MINKTTLLALLLSVSGVFGMTEAEFKALYERTDKDAEACYRLYEAYRDGDGVEKNADKARKWLMGAHQLGKPVYNEIATQSWRKKAKLKPGRKLTPKFSPETIQEKGKELFQVLRKTHPSIKNLYGEELASTQEKLTRQLLAEGADPNYAEVGRNTLSAALDGNHANLKIAKLLLAAGGDLEGNYRSAWDSASLAAMMEATIPPSKKRPKKGDPNYRLPFREIAKFMIKHGAVFSTHDSAGRTPLMIAVKSGSPEMVEIFCKAGADPNMKGNILEIAGPVDPKSYYYQIFRIGDEETPLFFSIHNANVALVECLLKHGADPTLANKNGVTPIQMAEKHMKEEQSKPDSRPEYVQKHRTIMQMLQQAAQAGTGKPTP